MNLKRFNQEPTMRANRRNLLVSFVEEAAEKLNIDRKKAIAGGVGLVLLGAILSLLSFFPAMSFVRPAEAELNSQTPARLIQNRNYDRLCVGTRWRPAMNLTFRDPKFPDVAGREIDWRAATTRIKRLVAQRGDIRVGLVVKNLKTGEDLEINANARFASASMVKIPLLITLYRDLADGKFTPSRGVAFEERLRASGSGKLKSEKSGVLVNIRDLAHLMLQHSDNTATNMLAQLVGYDHVTRYCRTMGWRNTDFVRPVMALEMRKEGVENWTTPKEMADMFERMHRKTMVSAGASKEMIRFMLNPPINDRLPRYLPQRIDVVHKTGLIYDNAHDVGIIYLPGDQPILISAFVDRIGTDYMAAKETIAGIARALYEEATPRSGWERGRRR